MSSPGQLQLRPEFQLASMQRARLRRLLLAGACPMAGLAALLWSAWLPFWQPLLATLSASLLLVMTSLESLQRVAHWRAKQLQAAAALDAEQPASKVAVSAPDAGARRWRAALAARCRGAGQRIWRPISPWVQPAMVGLGAATALGLVVWHWELEPEAAADVRVAELQMRYLIALALLALTFALLVVERFYAGQRPTELPEAPSLVYQLRVAMTVTLWLALMALWADDNRQWAITLLVAAGLLPAAIAIELLLRVLLSLFSPPSPAAPKLLADSFIAALWRWPPRPLGQLQDQLKQRYGVDLRQSWAFAYIRRALAPVVLALTLCAWLLTGLVEVPLAARGIYERFGAPVTVWQPGLQLGLPWPLGRVRLVENGVVHELTAITAGAEAAVAEPLAGAEGEAPASANRLWDASHVAEKSQLIASEINTAQGPRQSFQIVNMDVRFMYRIGLSDQDALRARYRSVDVAALIQSTASQILVSYFASRTLEGMLGERRHQMAAAIGARLQAQLDALESGVEIMATVLEAIHPPARAANAYHSVQAAEIGARAIVARERGQAAEHISLAQLRASLARDRARAEARETLATATASEQRFAAEQRAFDAGGSAFLLEQYLAQLTQGLAGAQLLIVDHRLNAANATFDLRDISVDTPTANDPAFNDPTASTRSIGAGGFDVLRGAGQ